MIIYFFFLLYWFLWLFIWFIIEKVVENITKLSTHIIYFFKLNYEYKNWEIIETYLSGTEDELTAHNTP